MKKKCQMLLAYKCMGDDLWHLNGAAQNCFTMPHPYEVQTPNASPNLALFAATTIPDFMHVCCTVGEECPFPTQNYK